MSRFALLMLLSASLHAAATKAADPSVDIGTAAEVYQAAAVREQVRASLDSMPAKIRQMFTGDTAAQLSAQQLDAVTAAAKRGFRITVFEPPALRALAETLDAATVRKSLAFLGSDLGKRMVAADVALAQLDEATIDKIMKGEVSVPTTPAREALAGKLDEDTKSTDSAVEIYLRIARSLAVGTAIGAGMDPIAAGDRAAKAADAAARADLEKDLRMPLRRYIAYGYRDLSDEDLKRLSAYLESSAGRRFVTAYNAAMNAGFDAMGQRCGEQIGESWREMAEAQAAPPPSLAAPPDIAAPDVGSPAAPAEPSSRPPPR